MKNSVRSLNENNPTSARQNKNCLKRRKLSSMLPPVTLTALEIVTWSHEDIFGYHFSNCEIPFIILPINVSTPSYVLFASGEETVSSVPSLQFSSFTSFDVCCPNHVSSDTSHFILYTHPPQKFLTSLSHPRITTHLV